MGVIGTTAISRRNKSNQIDKYEAIMRRERALAYALTHQQNLKSNLKSANTMFMNPNNVGSIARSSVSDDERLDRSTAQRRNMAPTKPARGKLKAQGSPGVALTRKTTKGNDGVIPEKAPAKKWLSCSPSPAHKPQRSSAPPKVENSVLKAVRTPCD